MKTQCQHFFRRRGSTRRLGPSLGILALITLTAWPSSSGAQENTRNGALLGGVTGAVIGGVVGHNHKDQTAEGALIGGAIGAVAGGLMGRHRDQVAAQQASRVYTYPNYPTHRPTVHPARRTVRHDPYYYGQPTIVYQAPVVSNRGFYRPTARPMTVARRPASVADVLHMRRSGVSDTVIVAHVQTHGVLHRPSVDDVVLMSQEGVSDYVITAMQTVGTSLDNLPQESGLLEKESGMRESGGEPAANLGTSIRTESRSLLAPPALERRGF